MKISFFILLLFAKTICAQPLVHEEPHHKPVFQNKQVRILNVVAQPGDTTFFHIHENDIGYLSIKGSTIWLQEFEGEEKKVELPSGWVGSDLTHEITPLVHRFANLGDSTFQLIAVEVLNSKYKNEDFSELGTKIHEDGRFSFQKVSSGILFTKVPCVLLELSERGEILSLDYLKANKKVPILHKNEQAEIIIIQLK